MFPPYRFQGYWLLIVATLRESIRLAANGGGGRFDILTIFPIAWETFQVRIANSVGTMGN
jgi:hypothetical protein